MLRLPIVNRERLAASVRSMAAPRPRVYCLASIPSRVSAAPSSAPPPLASYRRQCSARRRSKHPLLPLSGTLPDLCQSTGATKDDQGSATPGPAGPPNNLRIRAEGSPALKGRTHHGAGIVGSPVVTCSQMMMSSARSVVTWRWSGVRKSLHRADSQAACSFRSARRIGQNSLGRRGVHP